MAVQVTQDEATPARRTTHLLAPLLSIRMNFRRWSVLLLQIRVMLSRTRNTRNSRKSCLRSKRKTGKNFSSSRSANTSSSQNKMPTKRESSKSSSATSNRRRNCSKSTPSSNRRCSRDSRSHTLLLRRQKRNADLHDCTIIAQGKLSATQLPFALTYHRRGCPIFRVLCERWEPRRGRNDTSPVGRIRAWLSAVPIPSTSCHPEPALLGRERDLTMQVHPQRGLLRTPLPQQAHRTIPLERASTSVRDDIRDGESVSLSATPTATRLTSLFCARPSVITRRSA
jgi:hypothetical protein